MGEQGNVRSRGRLRIAIPIIILVALGLYSAFPHPTHDPKRLKAIAAEARHLMTTRPISAMERASDVPKDQWPPAIAELKPYSVTVYHGSVHIGTKPYFDGGWGYGFASDKRNLGMLPECWSDLGEGLFWHGPC
ncbi:hypothetical protein [Sphingobium sp. WCS2017Hpa-17]|uniref:hypothetical protein n=1 Tax=Sphingobium sp. WCS2017Hpa-17 TaxID=3073638 RepID=UPI00288B9606|nr:hypothetical protein [Sphingobium sp. WCS2017Hpa-17]